MEESNPPSLLPEVLQDCVVLLRQHPHALLRMAAGESELRESVPLFGQRLGRRAVVYEVQGRLTLEALVAGTEVIVEPLPRVYDEDLRILPDPRTLPIRLVVGGRGTEQNDMLKDPAVGTLEEVKSENCFAAARLPTDNRRVGVGW